MRAQWSWRDLILLGLGTAWLGLLVVWRATPREVREIRDVRVQVEAPEPTSTVHQELIARYGKSRYSLGPEELILRELFGDQRDGVFVDIGSADARILSNTYYLESVLGWRGLAVDAQTSYAPDYATYRPKTTFRSFFVSDVNDETRAFYLADQRVASSGDQAWAERFSKGGTVETTTVPTITLDTLLDREGITRIDLLSMDIESHEPQALAGFSIDRFRPRVICIEAGPDTRQVLLEYFTQHRYVLQAKYLEADPFNFYFVPLK